MKRITLLALFLLSLVVGVLCNGCTTPPAGSDPIETIEDDIVRAVEVGVGLALDSGNLTPDDQVEIAVMIETIARGDFEPVPGGPISAALEDAGFTDNQVRAIFFAVEQTLKSRGFDFGAAMTPRLSDLLFAVAHAVLSATPSNPKAES